MAVFGLTAAEATQLTPVSIHTVTKHNRLGGETDPAQVLQIS